MEFSTHFLKTDITKKLIQVRKLPYYRFDKPNNLGHKFLSPRLTHTKHSSLIKISFPDSWPRARLPTWLAHTPAGRSQYGDLTGAA